MKEVSVLKEDSSQADLYIKKNQSQKQKHQQESFWPAFSWLMNSEDAIYN